MLSSVVLLTASSWVLALCDETPMQGTGNEDCTLDDRADSGPDLQPSWLLLTVDQLSRRDGRTCRDEDANLNDKADSWPYPNHYSRLMLLD